MGINNTMKFFAVVALAFAVSVDQAATEQQDVDLSTAMDQMTPEQMETMLDAADEEIPASEDLGEMPEEDEEAEESEDEEPSEKCYRFLFETNFYLASHVYLCTETTHR